MSASVIDIAFREVRAHFKARTKLDFLNEIRGQIEDREELFEVLESRRHDGRFVAVSFDRKMNDQNFQYSYFDTILVLLDAASGGSGITKPVNQLRVMRWAGTNDNLKNILRYFKKNNTQVNFRRLLIVDYDNPVGHKISTQVFRK